MNVNNVSFYNKYILLYISDKKHLIIFKKLKLWHEILDLKRLIMYILL